VRNMRKLSDISDFVQQVCEATAAVVEVDITVFDSGLVRVAGTGHHKHKIGKAISTKAAFAQSLETGKPIYIFNPLTDKACFNCSFRETCTEVANIAFPIVADGEVLGLIALIAFNKMQRRKLMNHKENYSRFLSKMGELICSKLREQSAQVELIETSQRLETIVGFFPDGVIFTNARGIVVSVNPAAAKILGLTENELRGRDFRTVDDSHPLLQTLEDGRIRTNKEITRDFQGKTRHYLCSTQPIYNENVIMGAISFLKDYENVRKMVNEVGGYKNFLSFDQVLGEHSAILAAKEKAKRAARSNSTILIQGESGTGKELFARGAHHCSHRSNAPFIAINCAAIPETLLESELFGYEGGAFTGARNKGKPGKFELANGGTIFLDEIADMPLSLQAKLLRVLEERKIVRLGGLKPVAVDVKVIAATNKNLEEQVAKGEFREDLYYRLNVLPLKLPSLRERQSDIEILAKHFLEIYKKHNSSGVMGFSQAVLEAFTDYEWPGNVRELKNAVEYAVNMTDGPMIQINHIPEKIRLNDRHSIYNSLVNLKLMRIDEIEKALLNIGVKTFGNSDKAKKEIASHLGISRASVYRKLKKYGLSE
jgi:PAS domain S-box-containing protein